MADYADALFALRRRIRQSTKHSVSNAEYIDVYLDGLPQSISEFVGSHIDDEASLSDVVERSIRREDWLRRVKSKQKRGSRAYAAEEDESDDDSAESLQKTIKKLDQVLRKNLKDHQRSDSKEKARRKKRMFCDNCGSTGHATRD